LFVFFGFFEFFGAKVNAQMANPDTTLSTALHHGDPVVVQAAHGANVPVNFGAPHGLPITNKSTLLYVGV
jgi:hypothetical protein